MNNENSEKVVSFGGVFLCMVLTMTITKANTSDHVHLNVHKLRDISYFEEQQERSLSPPLSSWSADENVAVGAGFSLVDISPRYYYLREKGLSKVECLNNNQTGNEILEENVGLTADEAYRQVSYEYRRIEPMSFAVEEREKTGYQEFGVTIAKNVVDGEGMEKKDGVTSFVEVPIRTRLLSPQALGKEAVYLLYETISSKEIVIPPIMPTVLTFSENNKEMKEFLHSKQSENLLSTVEDEKQEGVNQPYQETVIDIYPKNRSAQLLYSLTEKQSSEKCKLFAEGDDSQEKKTVESVETGDKLIYTLKWKVPSDIGKVENYPNGIQLFATFAQGIEVKQFTHQVEETEISSTSERGTYTDSKEGNKKVWDSQGREKKDITWSFRTEDLVPFAEKELTTKVITTVNKEFSENLEDTTVASTAHLVLPTILLSDDTKRLGRKKDILASPIPIFKDEEKPVAEIPPLQDAIPLPTKENISKQVENVVVKEEEKEKNKDSSIDDVPLSETSSSVKAHPIVATQTSELSSKETLRKTRGGAISILPDTGGKGMFIYLLVGGIGMGIIGILLKCLKHEEGDIDEE